MNPVLRRPLRPEGRVWIEDEPAALLVDSANSAYMLMLRLLAYAYMVPRPLAEKSLAVDLSVSLMRAATQLAEAAARRPAGPSNPGYGQPDESAPAVNLTSLRENGPYAVRADIRLEGKALGYRATLCRCGASQNKPYCDGSHNPAAFVASGEPATGAVDMLPTRNGPLDIEPEVNGPLVVRGNLELLSGTGRAVARVTTARLCRCGGSANKPFCDNTHTRIGFKSV